MTKIGTDIELVNCVFLFVQAITRMRTLRDMTSLLSRRNVFPRLGSLNLSVIVELHD